MSIKRDLIIGEQGEKLVIDLFKNADITTKSNNDERYDLFSEHLYLGKFTTEVKNDIYSFKTGNIALEFFNPEKVKPSGISLTQADLWAHITNSEIWITSVPKLKEFIDEYEPLRIIHRGGDGNASFYLYRIDDILPSIFIRIDNISNKKLIKTLQKFL